MPSLSPALARRPAVPVALLYVALIVAAALTVLPFFWVVSGSLRGLDDFRSAPGAWLPSEVTFANYGKLFTEVGFGGFLVNSLIVATLTVVANVIGGGGGGDAPAPTPVSGGAVAVVAGVGTVSFHKFRWLWR